MTEKHAKNNVRWSVITPSLSTKSSSHKDTTLYFDNEVHNMGTKPNFQNDGSLEEKQTTRGEEVGEEDQVIIQLKLAMNMRIWEA